MIDKLHLIFKLNKENKEYADEGYHNEESHEEETTDEEDEE